MYIQNSDNLLNNYNRVKNSLNNNNNNNNVYNQYDTLVSQMKALDNYNNVTDMFINSFQSKLNDFEEVIHSNESKGDVDEVIYILIEIQLNMYNYFNIYIII